MTEARLVLSRVARPGRSLCPRSRPCRLTSPATPRSGGGKLRSGRGLDSDRTRPAIQRRQLRSVDADGRRIVPLTAIADLLGDELVLQYDGAMEVDVDLLSAIAIALVAEDVEAGRIEQDPEGPDWLILARELSKIRGVND